MENDLGEEDDVLVDEFGLVFDEEEDDEDDLGEFSVDEVERRDIIVDVVSGFGVSFFLGVG